MWGQMAIDTGITLAEAKLALARWLLADAELATGAQMSRINTGGTDRQLTRVDAPEIRENIKFWQEQVRMLSGGNTIPVYKVLLP